MKIYGLDFTSTPSAKKPITCAQCRLEGDTLHLESITNLESFHAFERFLTKPGPWVAGLDFPFGQPRKLIENLSWPQKWADYVNLIAKMTKGDFGGLMRIAAQGTKLPEIFTRNKAVWPDELSGEELDKYKENHKKWTKEL